MLEDDPVARRAPLSLGDRAQIAIGRQQGLGVRAIAQLIDRSPSVVSRELRRNASGDGCYRSVSALDRAKRRQRRPKARKIVFDDVLLVRVRADLRRSRTPRQIAARLPREACEATVKTMRNSPDAAGRTVSHEAIYRRQGLRCFDRRAHQELQRAARDDAQIADLGPGQRDSRPRGLDPGQHPAGVLRAPPLAVGAANQPVQY
jgi:IS30 family transposase